MGLSWLRGDSGNSPSEIQRSEPSGASEPSDPYILYHK